MKKMVKIPLFLALCFITGVAAASIFQQPDTYTRSPTGTTPQNPVTFTAEFTEDGYCYTGMYRFWVFASDGTPLYSLGSDTPLTNGVVTQTVALPNGVPVDNIRLACVDEFHNRYDSSSNLEGSAFTPHN